LQSGWIAGPFMLYWDVPLPYWRIEMTIPDEMEEQLHWYKSEVDGTMVVEIWTNPDADTDPNGPKIRVYLNDDVLFENPPYPVEN